MHGMRFSMDSDACRAGRDVALLDRSSTRLSQRPEDILADPLRVCLILFYLF